jgi:hypothetical protein
MSRINEKKMSNVKTQVLPTYFYVVACVSRRYDDIVYHRTQTRALSFGFDEKMETDA